PDTLRIEMLNGLEVVAGEAIVRFAKQDVLSNLERARSLADASDPRQIGATDLQLYLLQSKTQKVGDLVKLLASLPGVEYAEPNYIVRTTLTPNDTRFGELWGLNNTGQSAGTPGADISAVSAWDVSTGSSSIVVGVI